jgi:hypothetical protein
MTIADGLLLGVLGIMITIVGMMIAYIIGYQVIKPKPKKESNALDDLLKRYKKKYLKG